VIFIKPHFKYSGMLKLHLNTSEIMISSLSQLKVCSHSHQDHIIFASHVKFNQDWAEKDKNLDSKLQLNSSSGNKTKMKKTHDKEGYDFWNSSFLPLFKRIMIGNGIDHSHFRRNTLLSLSPCVGGWKNCWTRAKLSQSYRVQKSKDKSFF